MAVFNQRRQGQSAVGALVLLAILVASVAAYFLISAQPVRIAVMGPPTGNYASSGKAMVAAARLQAGRINETGGIRGRPLEIEPFNTRADPKRAAKLAQQIADSDAVAVVGAYFSSVAVEAAPAFKTRHLPAMTGSVTAPALAHDNPWYFRVVSDNDSKGRFSALGLKIGHRWAVDSSQSNTDKRLDAIIDALGNDSSESDALFVGLLGHDSAHLIAKMHAAHVERTIIGGDSVGLSSFRDAFKSMELSGRSIAAATDGVYTTTYFLPDVANQQAQQFIGAFRARFEREPRAVAAPNYDAVGLIAAALRQVKLDGTTQQLRDRLRGQLPRYNSLANAYRGVTGRLFFDPNGGVIKPSTFGVYSHGRLISAPVQLTPVVNPQAISGLDQLKQNGSAVAMGQAGLSHARAPARMDEPLPDAGAFRSGGPDCARRTRALNSEPCFALSSRGHETLFIHSINGAGS